MDPRVAAALLEAGIPFVGGLCMILLVNRTLGKKPGVDPQYDARMDKFAPLFKILGPVLMLGAIGFAGVSISRP